MLRDLISLLYQLVNLYEVVIIIWVIMSWLQMFGALPYSRPMHIFLHTLHSLTDPYLGRIRRILPLFGNLDLSPLVGILLLEVLKILLRDLMFRVT